MNDKDSSRASFRLQILAALVIGVVVWTVGGILPDACGPAGHHRSAGAANACTPSVGLDSGVPILPAILVPVAVPTSPMVEDVADNSVGPPREARHRRAARSAPRFPSVSAHVPSPVRYSLRL